MRFAVQHLVADELALIYRLLHDVRLKLKRRLQALSLEARFVLNRFGQEGSSGDTLSECDFADGVLSAKMKQLIAVAVVHATQPPYCIQDYIEFALREGATPEQVQEAIRVASKMRADNHSTNIATALVAIEMESRPYEKK